MHSKKCVHLVFLHKPSRERRSRTEPFVVVHVVAIFVVEGAAVGFSDNLRVVVFVVRIFVVVVGVVFVVVLGVVVVIDPVDVVCVVTVIVAAVNIVFF